MKIIAKIYLFFRRIRSALLVRILKPLFLSCGKNVWFDPYGHFSFANITIGNNVRIGVGAEFVISETTLTIGNNVMFGPNVTIRGGNHNTSQIGQYMLDVKIKRDEDDQPVIIEDDVWVGTRAIILKGVRIGRGAIISAGAVVTKDVDPYSIVGGIPARRLKWRWDANTIIEHEKLLYPEYMRLDTNYLQDLQNTERMKPIVSTA